MADPNQQRPVVLVTGGSGLIGRRVAESLAPDHTVVALDINRPDSLPQGGDFIECDLTRDEGVAAALREVRDKHGETLASVVHLAAYYDFSGEPSPLYEKLTVEGTRRLLRNLREFDARQFIFSSSLLVMKPVEPGQSLTEDSETQAEWDYPQSKLRAEEVIRQEHGDIPAVVLRLAGVYDADCHSIPIGQQIERIYERQLESHFFPGDPDHGQSFIHLDDVAACFHKTIEHREKLGPYEVFLIGEPDLTSYEELQDRLGELIHGSEWPTIRIPKAVAKVGAWVEEHLHQESFIKPWMIDLADAHYPVDVSKAAEKLGWTPRRRLRDELPTIVTRLKEDPQRWYRINGLTPPGQ